MDCQNKSNVEPEPDDNNYIITSNLSKNLSKEFGLRKMETMCNKK